MSEVEIDKPVQLPEPQLRLGQLAEPTWQNRLDALLMALFSQPFYCHSSNSQPNSQSSSCFFPPAQVEPLFRLGSLVVYKRLDQLSNFVGTLFKLNLLFFVAVVFYCTFQVCSSREGLRSSWLGPPLLGAVLPAILMLTMVFLAFAGILWFLEIPKRLKVLSGGLALRCDITGDVFIELALPWASLESINFLELSRFNSVKESFVEIRTIFGIKHLVRHSDLLLDNSEASFLNSIATWAPQLLPREVSPSLGPQFTELWLHQFSTSNKRREIGNLPVGAELKGGVYKVAGLLGGGGQGTAYLAVVHRVDEPSPLDKLIGREVVLKEYIMPVYQGSEAMAALSGRLQQEAEVLRHLDHPGVVKLYDCFCEDYRGYLVLEYVDGHSLKERVGQKGPLDQGEVVTLAIQLCRVLIYMHTLVPPVVHRDLSPDNIMLNLGGEVKIVDFNVARRLEPGSGSTVVGKHAYIPPEQFRGKPCAQSDIYAFGGTLFFLLTGEEPEPLTVSHPRQVKKNVSPALDETVARCTALQLENRFKSFSAVLDEFVKIRDMLIFPSNW